METLTGRFLRMYKTEVLLCWSIPEMLQALENFIDFTPSDKAITDFDLAALMDGPREMNAATLVRK